MVSTQGVGWKDERRGFGQNSFKSFQSPLVHAELATRVVIETGNACRYRNWWCASLSKLYLENSFIPCFLLPSLALLPIAFPPSSYSSHYPRVSFHSLGVQCMAQAQRIGLMDGLSTATHYTVVHALRTRRHR